MYNDTIAAISTPVGEGGIGIVRLSGPDALTIVQKLFDRKLHDRRLAYGHITDPINGEGVDEVLVSYMAAPHTYTTEDIVEINCHGGLLPLQRVLELVLTHGARISNPGEFTLRAFLNGRIDLSQAESVLDIVRARTSAGLRIAVNGLCGNLSQQIQSIRTGLMGILAYLTARIDFPEDEVPEQDIVNPINNSLDKLEKLLATADQGMIYRQGIRTAIIGRRNVGKSSLLNRLLGSDRAIVSPVPGTTRDTLEEVVNIGGIPFVLIDTAGMGERKGIVESMGMERSRSAVKEADLVLLVLDGSAPLRSTDRGIISLLKDDAGKEILAVINKCDRPSRANLNSLQWSTVHISALTGKGMNDLEQRMADSVLGSRVTSSDALLVSNPRHKACLQQAAGHLRQALEAIGADMPDDFITIDLTSALNALGEITGESVSEELLETIFSNFCIGK